MSLVDVMGKATSATEHEEEDKEKEKKKKERGPPGPVFAPVPAPSAGVRGPIFVQVVAALLILLITLPAALALTLFSVQVGGISVFHTFGNGFVLDDDQVETYVAVRNNSQFSLPYVNMYFSYGAVVAEGSTRCFLPTIEGSRACDGTAAVGLGSIVSGEIKRGPVLLLPAGNFTLEYDVYASLFTYPWKVAWVLVSCQTHDRRNYSCVTVQADSRTPPPPAGLAYVFWTLSVILFVAGAVSGMSVLIRTVRCVPAGIYTHLSSYRRLTR